MTGPIWPSISLIYTIWQLKFGMITSFLDVPVKLPTLSEVVGQDSEMAVTALKLRFHRVIIWLGTSMVRPWEAPHG